MSSRAGIRSTCFPSWNASRILCLRSSFLLSYWDGCIDKKLSSIQTELDANTNMTRRLQSRKAELYEQYRAGRLSREKFTDIQKANSEKLARLSSRAEEIERLLVEHYESRGDLAAGKRSADQIILLKDYDPEIIRNFVERVRVYPSGEIEIDMRTSSGFALRPGH